MIWSRACGPGRRAVALVDQLPGLALGYPSGELDTMTPILAGKGARDMLVAILKVHLPHGLFASNGGFEFPMACGAIAFALIFTGSGPIAIDWLWGSKGR